MTLEAPGSHPWEGTHTLNSSDVYSVSSDFNYIHYSMDEFSFADQEALADYAAQVPSSQQLVITFE